MSKTEIDISVIVTAHNEGRLAHHTMRSIFRGIGEAEEAGIKCQIIAVLDNPSEETADYFTGHTDSRLRIEKVNFSDPGLARNHGIRLAVGKYAAIIDADDLYGYTWLRKAYALAELSEQNCVFHPEFAICFDAQNLISRYKGTSESSFDFANLMEFNGWISNYLARSSLLLDNPYQGTPINSGFGYEDWHWYCEALAKGIEIKIVPETCVFYRKKKRDSRLIVHVNDDVMCRPSKLFDCEIFSNLCERQESLLTRRDSIIAGIKSKIHKLIETKIRLYPKLHTLVLILRDIAKRLRRRKTEALRIPVWLSEEWKGINTIEPQIFPDRHLLETIEVYEIPNSRIGRHYLELCELYGKNVSHVFLIPWLKRGGSDLVTINYIKTLVENGLAKRITVIADMNSDSPWAERLPEGVNFIEFGKMYPHFSEDEKEKLLTRLLIQMAPKVVHNINSELGYKIFTKYGKALNSVPRLYASSFCKDVSEEGKDVGYPFSYLPECFDNLQAVLSDNQSFLDRLHELYAFDRQKLITHYQPYRIEKRRKYVDRISQKGRMDVLWAGRIDRQKRPDILAAIAAASRDFPFHFHVYGSSLLDKDVYTKQLKRLKNVTLFGAYDGLPSLPVQNFDLFLYTSQWDGLPNILLEAIALGLPVVASKVGGIGELIINHETGYLVDPYYDAEQFMQCLKKLYSDRSDLPRILDNAYNLVASRHSWEHFLADISKTPGYILHQDNTLE